MHAAGLLGELRVRGMVSLPANTEVREGLRG